MSKRKRAHALHRWEPAHSEKLRKFDLGCWSRPRGRRHLVITDRPHTAGDWSSEVLQKPLGTTDISLNPVPEK
jgi:hypothetical protein